MVVYLNGNYPKGLFLHTFLSLRLYFFKLKLVIFEREKRILLKESLIKKEINDFLAPYLCSVGQNRFNGLDARFGFGHIRSVF